MMSLPEGQSLNGCAIRLGPVKGLIGVAEGIETALSVRAATGLTCWSTVSAYGMSVFEPPEGVKIVLIWADKDRSETGAKAAKALMRRLAEKVSSASSCPSIKRSRQTSRALTGTTCLSVTEKTPFRPCPRRALHRPRKRPSRGSINRKRPRFSSSGFLNSLLPALHRA